MIKWIICYFMGHKWMPIIDQVEIRKEIDRYKHDHKKQLRMCECSTCGFRK